MKVRGLRVALAALPLATSAGCGNLFAPAAAAVGTHKITIDEVEAALDTFEKTPEFDRLAQQQGADLIRRQYQQGYLSRLIRREVLEPRAEDLGIEVTDADVQTRLEEIKKDFPSEEAFADALAQQGLQEEELHDLVLDSLLEEGLRSEVTADAASSDDELQAYYQSHQAEFTQMHAQHILVDDKATAERISKQLRAAPTKQVDELWAKLAGKFSRDASNAKDSGDLGFTSSTDLVPEFQQAADALGIGEISKPVKTQFGFHIIRVLERNVQPFGEVQDQIVQAIGTAAQDNAWAEWLRDAYEDADVRVNPRFGELDLASGQVVDASAETIPGAEIPSPSPTNQQAVPQG